MKTTISAALAAMMLAGLTASAEAQRFSCTTYNGRQTYCNEMGRPLPRNQMDQRMFQNDPRMFQNSQQPPWSRDQDDE